MSDQQLNKATGGNPDQQHPEGRILGNWEEPKAVTPTESFNWLGADAGVVVCDKKGGYYVSSW